MKEQYLLLLMKQHRLCMREIKLLKNHEAFVRRNVPGAVSANNELLKYQLYKQDLKEELYELATAINIDDIIRILNKS